MMPQEIAEKSSRIARTICAGRTAVGDEVDDVGVDLRRPQLPADPRPARTAQGRRIQACANSLRNVVMSRRWDSAGSASVTRDLCTVKHLIRWHFAARPQTCCASSSIRHLAVIDRLELEFEPGLNVLTGETGAGKSILVGAVGLLVGGRASADLVRTGEDTATVEAIFETPDGERNHRPPRDVGAGPEPRARSTARSRRARRFASCAAASSISTASTSTRCCSIRRRISICSTSSPALPPSASGVAAAFARWQHVRAERDRLADRRAREGRRAPSSSSFQLAEIDRAAPQARRGRGARRATRRCSPTPTSCSGCAPRRTTRSTKGTRRRCRRSASSGASSASSPRSTRASRPYLDARDSVKSQLEDLAYFLRSYALDIDASPARLQEVEDRLALLERLKRKHGPTLADVIAQGGRRCARELHDIEHATERAAELDARSRRPRAGLPARPRRRCRRGGARRRREFSRALEKSLADLAMTRTRCEVRFTPTPTSEAQWSERGHRRRGVLHLAEPRRGPAAAGAHRVGRRAVAHHAGAEDARLDRRARQDADLRRGRRRHRRRGRRRRRRPAAAARRARSRCSASRTCRRSPRTAATHYRIEKSVRGGRTVDRASARRRRREAELRE